MTPDQLLALIAATAAEPRPAAVLRRSSRQSERRGEGAPRATEVRVPRKGERAGRSGGVVSMNVSSDVIDRVKRTEARVLAAARAVSRQITDIEELLLSHAPLRRAFLEGVRDKLQRTDAHFGRIINQLPADHVCQAPKCGKSFQAGRKDARFCPGGRCRQRAFQARRRNR